MAIVSYISIVTPTSGSLVTDKFPEITGIVGLTEIPSAIVLKNLSAESPDIEYPAIFVLNEDNVTCNFSCNDLPVRDTDNDEPIQNQIRTIVRHATEEFYTDFNYSVKVNYISGFSITAPNEPIALHKTTASGTITIADANATSPNNITLKISNQSLSTPVEKTITNKILVPETRVITWNYTPETESERIEILDNSTNNIKLEASITSPRNAIYSETFPLDADIQWLQGIAITSPVASTTLINFDTTVNGTVSTLSTISQAPIVVVVNESIDATEYSATVTGTAPTWTWSLASLPLKDNSTNTIKAIAKYTPENQEIELQRTVTIAVTTFTALTITLPANNFDNKFFTSQTSVILQGTAQALQPPTVVVVNETNAPEIEVDTTVVAQSTLNPNDAVSISATLPAYELSGWDAAPIGQQFILSCPATTSAGAVYGTDNYHQSSSIFRAAVHSGILRDSVGGIVTIIKKAGVSAYTGSTRYGIASSNASSGPSSFQFAYYDWTSDPVSLDLGNNSIKAVARHQDGDTIISPPRDIERDIYSPRLIYSTVESGQTNVPINTAIVLVFNEPLDTTTAITALSLTPSASGSWLASDNNTVFYYSYSVTLLPETSYTIAIQNTAQDRAGNTISNNTITFTTGTAKGARLPNRLGDTVPTYVYDWNGITKLDFYSQNVQEISKISTTESQFPSIIYPFMHNAYNSVIVPLNEKETTFRSMTSNVTNQWVLDQAYLGTWLNLRSMPFNGKIVPTTLEIGSTVRRNQPPVPPPAGIVVNPRGTFNGIETYDSSKPVLVWGIPPIGSKGLILFKVELTQNDTFARPIIFTSEYHSHFFTLSKDNGLTFEPLRDGISSGSTHCKFICPFGLTEGKWHTRGTIFIKPAEDATANGETVTIPPIP